MKPTERIVPTVIALIKQDWRESWKPLALLSAGAAAAAPLAAAGPPWSYFSEGMIPSLIVAASYILSQTCFHMQRRRGVLSMVAALPLTRRDLAVLKFVSLYSMTLIPVNLMAVMFQDPQFALRANAAALFLATVYLAPTMLSEGPMAGMAPFMLTILAALPVRDHLFDQNPPADSAMAWVLANGDTIAIGALGLVPVIAVFTVWLFTRHPDGLK